MAEQESLSEIDDYVKKIDKNMTCTFFDTIMAAVISNFSSCRSSGFVEHISPYRTVCQLAYLSSYLSLEKLEKERKRPEMKRKRFFTCFF